EGTVTDETVADGDRNRLAGPGRTRQIVGFGGGHYAPRFERILRETDWRVGHVAADWSLQAMGGPDANREVIERAFAQSAATRAVVAGDNPELEAVVDDLGYRVVDETWLRETTGVDLDLVAAAERALVPVDEGLRFGAPARDVASDALGPVAAKSESGVAEPAAPDGFDVVSLPEDLLAEAAGIDEAATMDAVRAHVTAFETVEGGTKPRGRALVASGAGSPLESVVDDLAAVLREKYDAVEREDDRIVATREAFDPAAAADAGVAEGPAFGRLSAGESVEVDGREVAPEAVHTEETVSFPV
ncbi:MAG: D-aminoacyl-tRNA deacylase, partial [Haloquadratum sp.]